MKNVNNLTSTELRTKLKKIIKVSERTDAFESLGDKIRRILNQRNRAAIYREACRVLKRRNSPNQFAAAAQYADAVINGSDYFETDDHHEIGSFYTKAGEPVIVDF